MHRRFAGPGGVRRGEGKRSNSFGIEAERCFIYISTDHFVTSALVFRVIIMICVLLLK